MSDNRKLRPTPYRRHLPCPALRGLAIGILLGLSPAAVWAESTPTIRLVTGDNYAPFSDQSLPEGGLATHLVRYLFEQMDQPVEIDITGWPAGYQAALDGAYAGTFPYIESEQRLEHYLFSDPLFTVSSFAYVDQSSTINASSPEDLAGLTLCLPEGFAHGFQTVTDGCEVFYQMSTPYHPDSAAGLHYLDPHFSIAWPLPVTRISDADRSHPEFSSF